MKVKIKRNIKVQHDNKALGGKDLSRGEVLEFSEHVANKLVDAGIATLVEAPENKILSDDLETKPAKRGRPKKDKK